MTTDFMTEETTMTDAHQGDWHPQSFVYSVLVVPSLEETKASMIRCLEMEGLSFEKLAQDAGRHFTDDVITPVSEDSDNPALQSNFMDDLNAWEDD